MRAISGTVFSQDYYSPSTAQNHNLGTRLEVNDGRLFRYAKAGTVDVAAGVLLQSPAPIPFHLALTPPVVAAQERSFLVTPGATGGEINLYGEGFLGVDTAPSAGLALYRIASHPLIVASTAFAITLEEPLQIGLTAASRIGLLANPYKNVIVNPTTRTGGLAGVAPFLIPAGQYGWVQTWGPAVVLINGTPALGAPVGVGATTAGSIDTWTVGPQLGEMLQLGVSGKYNFVYLRIAA